MPKAITWPISIGNDASPPVYYAIRRMIGQTRLVPYRTSTIQLYEKEIATDMMEMGPTVIVHLIVKITELAQHRAPV